METNEQETMPPAESADAEVEQARTALGEAEERLIEAEGRADEEHRRAEGYLALLKRERADFTNYRRRIEQERAEQAEAAIRGLILALLPALDDLERALANAPDGEANAPLVEGIRLIDRSLRTALERAGLVRINTQGQRFAPQVHEALMQEEAPDRAEGEVVRELRPGYRLGNRVLRPAQVSVAHGATSTAPGCEKDDPSSPPPQEY